jgi:hypothetical protein
MMCLPCFELLAPDDRVVKANLGQLVLKGPAVVTCECGLLTICEDVWCVGELEGVSHTWGVGVGGRVSRQCRRADVELECERCTCATLACAVPTGIEQPHELRSAVLVSDCIRSLSTKCRQMICQAGTCHCCCAQAIRH